VTGFVTPTNERRTEEKKSRCMVRMVRMVRKETEKEGINLTSAKEKEIGGNHQR
jgi:hypothetical protein